MHGEHVQSNVQASAKTGVSVELVHIELHNTGLADGPLPRQVRVHWTGGRLVAADGLMAFTIEQQDADTLVLSAPDAAHLAVVAPEAVREIAWLRFDREVELEVKCDGMDAIH